MANTSIFNAFERMWQHVTTALSKKSDTGHSHSNATQSASGFLSAEDKIQLDNGGVPIVAASSSDGVAYTATVDGITALTAGAKITIIPDINSASVSPTLNVNSLGAKYIRMPISYNTAASSAGVLTTWLVKSKPVVVEYDGTYWKTISMPRPSAQYLYGAVPIVNGGTGATTAENARSMLGAISMNTTSVQLTASDWSSNSQTVSVSGVTADDTIFVAPTPGTHTTYMECGVFCTAQGSGTLTFECEETPTEDVDVNIGIFK